MEEMKDDWGEVEVEDEDPATDDEHAID
jgi:hypothetical protein